MKKEIVLKNFEEMTLLYAEDDIKARDNIIKILTLLFKKVLVASDGQEAFKLFQENKIDMILTDYEMPHLNGYEFILKVREVSQNIPIIILSNHTDKEKLLKCMPLKLAQYLEKPIVYETLLETFTNSIKNIPQNQQILHRLSDKIFYNQNLKKIISNEEEIELSTLEVEVLEYLLQKRNSIVCKTELVNLICKGENYSEASLKNIIYRLRKKIGKDFIQNQKNMGYCLKIL